MQPYINKKVDELFEKYMQGDLSFEDCRTFAEQIYTKGNLDGRVEEAKRLGRYEN